MSDALGVEEIILHFEGLRETYADFGDFLQRHIEAMLRDAQIAFFKTEMRVKEFDSLDKKVKRYKIETVEEIGDFLGLRIICYFPSGVEQIRAMVRSAFRISDDEDKGMQAKPDQFGYRSHHLTFSLPPEAAGVPLLKKFEQLRAELQIRTLQMHSWAALEHAWSYKSSFEVPAEVLKEIAFLSATLEQADRQIEIVARKRQEYIDGLRNGQLLNEQLSLDSLERFLEVYIPKRKDGREDARRLLEDMLEWNISFCDLNEVFTTYGCHLDGIETDVQPRCHYSRAGAFRVLLDICDGWPDRWRSRERLLTRFPDSASKIDILRSWKSKLLKQHEPNRQQRP